MEQTVPARSVHRNVIGQAKNRLSWLFQEGPCGSMVEYWMWEAWFN